LFCEHAVLQQGMPISVWGTADENEKVTVTLAGHTASRVCRCRPPTRTERVHDRGSRQDISFRDGEDRS